jgi:hypothetical protein
LDPTGRWRERIGKHPPDFGTGSGGHGDGQCGAVDHRGALVQHAGSLGQTGTGRGSSLLGHRRRLAGEDRFVGLAALCLQDPAVGRYDVAGGELDDVAPDDLGRFDDGAPTRPAHRHGHCAGSEQPIELPVGAQALGGTDHHVGTGYSGHQGGIGGRAGQGG